MPSDALGIEAYDGDENTYVEAINATANKYINVSKELWNQKIYVKMSGALAGNITLNADLIFIKEDGTEISKIQSGRGALSGEYQIPTGTSKIKIQLSYFSDQYGKARIYEIKLCTKPVANLEIKNPTLTEYGIKSMYNLVSLDYFQTSIQRLYRINGGEWQEYTDKVRLEIGDKLEAKGIDKYGIETSFLTQQFQYGNALGLEAYDGDENTYVEAINATANKYINVSKELWNQKIYVKMSGALAGNITLNADLIFIKEDGTEISKIQSGRGALSGEYQIPTGTSKIKIQLSYFSDQYGKARIYEISPSTTPTIIQTNTYPQLSSTSFDKAKYQITINYLSYFQQKLYSLDNGTTWLDYKGIINVKAGDVIQAKAIDKDGKETEVSTYTVKGLTDNLDDKAFDKDKNTSVTLSSKQTKSFILDGVDNEVLRIYTTGKVDTRAYIKLYDKENKELSTVTLNEDLTTLVIPEGSVKASIYSGTSTLTINEVNLREVKASKENYPEITINDTNWTTTKAVEILYPEGTEREYSLDLGTTWNKYTNELTIEKETTIFARSIKDGTVISTNSYVITKVDNEVPTINLDIPDEMVKGANYSLPTSYTTGKSGGTPVCKINNETIDNTKDLESGNYLIECSITSTSGLTANISKSLTILSSMNLSSAIKVDNQLITDLPTLTTSSNNTSDKSGLYVSNLTNSGNNTYYFRGNVDNNNVSFAGMNWKIVRINEDDSIRIILDSPIDKNQKYTYNSSKNKENMYYNESDVKPVLDSWYTENLNEYDSKISYSNYCSEIHALWDRTWSSDKGMVYNQYNPTFKCDDPLYTYNLKVGLINYDETVFAGAYYGKQNDKYYLYTGYAYWTMSTAGYYDSSYGSATWVVGTSGTFAWNYFYARDSYIIRPVINLSSNVAVEGHGTSSDPYVVK